ncbi:hypothetical protein FV768_23830 [Vibrio parahaemolyticus]|uniref:phage minor tail protein G n=1 Tax=Vibrio TaxID=662 RepID=UPI00100EB66D|nr:MULTISPECIES: phage minor tail protein G [Vibrio]EGQ9818951.1 hypothetical protein [Vibrio parahaemolyticus]EGR0268337.1 hypothetical protein [Vibrio alginolyticus]ELH9641314.1 hypothetical protein [Vibrio alginolyticus]MBY7685814.1 hypothetical protein [Vibrio alginolyticus]MCR9713944.1 hypothetical protein [Vibrio parahaemolyticus]
MNFLNTLPLQVGKESFIISEFTALDRLHDLKYETELPKMVPPKEDALEKEKIEYGLYREETVLDQVSHSIALSLAHSHSGDDACKAPYDHVLYLQNMIKSQWPNRKVNEAYEKLKVLNDPNFEPEEDDQAPKEPPTPEKS